MPVNTDSYIFEALKLEGLLRAYLSRYAKNPADSEELLQETYARLLAVPAAQRADVQSVQAFALATAKNIAVDWLRHRDVVPIELVGDLEELNLLVDDGRLEEMVSAHQQLQHIAAVVAQMPARRRQVFTLRKVYGMTQKEIAAKLKISENTVEQHLTKAARGFAERLPKELQAERKGGSLMSRLRTRLSREERE